MLVSDPALAGDGAVSAPTVLILVLVDVGLGPVSSVGRAAIKPS